MKTVPKFATEADLVAAFCADMASGRPGAGWTIYPETAGFDLLLVEKATGIQLGLEAKLSLNVRVLTQALPDWEWREHEGPDYRGILVPEFDIQHGLSEITRRLGLGIIGIVRRDRDYGKRHYTLPDEQGRHSYSPEWHPWLPTRRCDVPAYVPDVVGGKPAPIQLTDWKIRAIKMLILLDRRGFVTRADFKALQISAARWTCPGGYLEAKDGAFVRWKRTPDFRAEHPVNTTQIEADFDKWAPPPSLVQQPLRVVA